MFGSMSSVFLKVVIGGIPTVQVVHWVFTQTPLYLVSWFSKFIPLIDGKTDNCYAHHHKF